MELITAKEVCELLGISQRSIFNWVKSRNFPKPYKVGANKWDKEQVIEWVKTQQD